MRASTLTAMGAMFGIIIGALVFMLAVIREIPALTVVGIALLAIGVIFLFQGGYGPQEPRH